MDIVRGDRAVGLDAVSGRRKLLSNVGRMLTALSFVEGLRSKAEGLLSRGATF